MAWSCDGRRLASGSFDRTVSIFVLEKDRLVSTVFISQFTIVRFLEPSFLVTFLIDLNSLSDSFTFFARQKKQPIKAMVRVSISCVGILAIQISL